METLPQLFRYTAREYDPATGLYHYRARTYDPATGRFLQEDPIGLLAGDNNFYRYVFNNPLVWNDPTGLSATGEYGANASSNGAKGGGVAITGRNLACLFGTIASVVDVTEFGLRNIKVDRANCGAASVSVQNVKRLRKVACYGVKGGRKANSSRPS